MARRAKCRGPANRQHALFLIRRPLAAAPIHHKPHMLAFIIRRVLQAMLVMVVMSGLVLSLIHI